ncbi:MAG: preprotein translocase subunit SecE [Bacteroidia bacterium]|nr:preprotein translocase subunit SecE [Bacteroidia bacterium]
MKLKLYFEEAYNELVHKVSWPSWSELQNSAVLVMIATAILAILIAIMDTSFRNLMKLIYSMFF